MRLSLPLHPHTSAGGVPGASGGARPGQGQKKFRPGWRVVLVMLVILVGLFALTLSTTLFRPGLSRYLATSLPANWLRLSSEQALLDLDRNSLQPSQLPEAQLDALRERFASLSAPAEGALPYRIVFRHASQAAPLLQTFADGEIVVSDHLFELVANQEEQLALLCQALGHLRYRHSLNNAVEQHFLRIVGAALTGSSMLGIPPISSGLLNTTYSREQLFEADAYALSMLHTNGFPTGSLIAAMKRVNARQDIPSIAASPYIEERIEILQRQQ